MTKQNFISMSLESGLKVRLNQKGVFNLDEEYPQPHDEICEITQIINCGGHFEYEISDGNISYGFIEIDEFDILARHLSDLTKEIEHGGKKFVPIDGVAEFFIEGTEDVLEQSIAAIEYFIENNFFSRMEYLPFILIQKLISWHFDIYDLISKNQAIDINTLETNPYK